MPNTKSAATSTAWRDDANRLAILVSSPASHHLPGIAAFDPFEPGLQDVSKVRQPGIVGKRIQARSAFELIVRSSGIGVSSSISTTAAQVV
jgi:hypothetical protein